MMVFQGAVNARFAALGTDATHTPASGDLIPVEVSPVVRTRSLASANLHAETSNFEVRASEVENPRAGDRLTVANERRS